MSRLLKKIYLLIFGRSARTQAGEFRRDRAHLIQWGLFCLFGLIAVRAVILHIFPSQGDSLQHLADNQYQQEITLAPSRGNIFDHRGEPLAISVKRPSLAVNPRIFNPSAGELSQLTRILKISPQKLRRFATKKSYFAWVARQLDQRIADAAMNLGLVGLVEINEPARYYPSGSAAAQILGFTGLDNGGLSGLERQFDRDLRGKGVKVMASKDARGNFIVNEAIGAAPERTGNSILLTIDSVIQEIAEEELSLGVKNSAALRGFAIVSDPNTGRILAVANYPSFDPNNSRHVKMIQARNNAFLDTFEPGSVIKPFIIAQAIENKSTHPDEIHNCESGSLKIGNHTIHDTHGADKLTTAETLIRSSNICTYKIANEMGRESTYNALNGFGFAGKNSLLGFPGESTGYITDFHKWAQVRFANVSFGHGFAVTGLELVQGMGALANGGHLMKPALVERIVSSDGLLVNSVTTKVVRDVVSPATARTMRNLLQRVVTDPHGTGKKAKAASYSTAGKTGTAQKVEPGLRGYAKGKYISSFVGFSPVEDPHLVVYVMIDEPSGKLYYGGEVAGPIFAHIVERSLRYLNVAPDLPDQQGKTETPPLAKTEHHGTNAKKM